MTSTQHPEIPDGLRAWQSMVVRLWSAGDEAFAMLTMSWLPEGIKGAPWTVRLQYGDEGSDYWSQDISVSRMPTLQQALHRLWQRTEMHRRMLKEDPQHPSYPEDFADNAWLTSDEVDLLERLAALLQPRQPIALQFSYRPELGLSSQWTAVLHDPAKEPPEGILVTVHGAHLAEVCNLLIETSQVNIEDSSG